MKTEKSNLECNGYQPGHPWYFFLGGRIPTPKQIIADVKASKYKGYREDEFLTADRKEEPHRSAALRRIRDEEIQGYRKDLSRYRKLACELRKYRLTQELSKSEDVISCDDIHVNINLKYNHLFNRFAHLLYLDELLSRQPDLFDV